MMRVISVWIKNPVAGWAEEQREQYSRKYTCILELVNDICIERHFDASKVRLLPTDIVGKCMKQTAFVKTRLQEENPQVNQAEYEIRIVTEVCE